MNIAAAVFTGDICDGIMIEGDCHLRVVEMKFDPLMISPPVLHFPWSATYHHAIRQKETVLEFRVRHFPTPLRPSNYLTSPKSFGKTGGNLYSAEGEG